LHFQSKENFPTLLGGLFTIIIIVFSLLFSVDSLLELFDRNVPSTSCNNIILNSPPDINFNDNRIIFAFFILDKDFQFYDYQRYFDLDLYHINIINNDKNKILNYETNSKNKFKDINYFNDKENYITEKDMETTTNTIKLNLTNCYDRLREGEELKYFYNRENNILEQLEKNNFFNATCFKNQFGNSMFNNKNETINNLNGNDLYIKGNVNSKNFSFLQLKVKMCSPSNRKNCLTNFEDLSDKIKNSQLGIHLIDKSINPFNYNNPVNYDLRSYYFSVDEYFTKTIEINLKNSTLLSDSGLIIQNWFQTTIFSLNYLSEKISMKDSEKNIAIVNIKSSFNSDYCKRNYMKIQIFAARIGGIINAAMFIANLIIKFINKHLMHSIIMNNLFDFQIKNEGLDLIKKKFNFNFYEEIEKKEELRKSSTLNMDKNNFRRRSGVSIGRINILPLNNNIEQDVEDKNDLIKDNNLENKKIIELEELDDEIKDNSYRCFKNSQKIIKKPNEDKNNSISKNSFMSLNFEKEYNQKRLTMTGYNINMSLDNSISNNQKNFVGFNSEENKRKKISPFKLEKNFSINLNNKCSLKDNLHKNDSIQKISNDEEMRNICNPINCTNLKESKINFINQSNSDHNYNINDKDNKLSDELDYKTNINFNKNQINLKEIILTQKNDNNKNKIFKRPDENIQKFYTNLIENKIISDNISEFSEDSNKEAKLNNPIENSLNENLYVDNSNKSEIKNKRPLRNRSCKIDDKLILLEGISFEEFKKNKMNYSGVLDIGIIQLFILTFCFCKKTVKRKNDFLFECQNEMGKYLDYIKIIELLKEFNRLKKILFSNNQLKLFSYLPNAKVKYINDEFDIDNLYQDIFMGAKEEPKKLSKLLHSFVQVKSKQTNCSNEKKINERIIDYMDKELKKCFESIASNYLNMVQNSSDNNQ